MKTNKRKVISKFFEDLAAKATQLTGSTPAIIIAFLTVIIWAVSGPIFHYSENWQLVINTGTTIITFLMVFLIQKSQNKDSLAIQLKLDELIATHELADNKLVDVENLSEEELKVLQKFYRNFPTDTVKKTGKKAERQEKEIDKKEQVKEKK